MIEGGRGVDLPSQPHEQRTGVCGQVLCQGGRESRPRKRRPLRPAGAEVTVAAAATGEWRLRHQCDHARLAVAAWHRHSVHSHVSHELAATDDLADFRCADVLT